MYREKDLQDCLSGLIGFRQNVNPDYEELAPSLLLSASGLYVQDQHPLLCIENIDQALKNYDHFNYPDYDEDEAYDTGAKVRFTDGKAYESLDDANEGNDPDEAGSEFWVEVKLLSQKLDAVLRSASGKIVAEVFEKKKIEGATKSILESVTLFEGGGMIIDKEIKTGRFVGYSIGMNAQRDLSAVIRRLGTQFSEANPDFKLYVYHSSQAEPVKVFDLNLTKVNSFEWSRLLDSGLDFVLPYSADGHGSGGYFYIGYYEDDLEGQAINREYDFANAPTCGSCSNNYALYQSWSQYFDIVPFYVPASYLEDILPGDPGGPLLWDLGVMQASYTRNFGLNLDLSVRCDVTDYLCRERGIFASAMAKQVTVDLLNILAFSTRNNAITKEVKSAAIYALNNRDNNTPGESKRLESAIKALSFDMSGLNSACLPCDNSRGPEYAAI